MSDYLGSTRVSELWSKIKERVSKKQDVLTGAPGQLIGIGNDGAAKATVYPLNKNLLDNSLFVGGGSQQGGGQFPINQRGETEYTTAGCTIDRWKNTIATTTVKVTSSGIELGIGAVLRQYFENTNLFNGKQVTLSALVGKSLLSLTFTWSNSQSYLVSEPMNGFIVAYSGTSKYVHIYNQSGDSDVIVAAKLELGPFQTLAHKEGDTWVLNEIPNFAEQYAICAQYDPNTGEFIGPVTKNDIQTAILDSWEGAY